MRVRLTKSWKNSSGRVYPRGWVLHVTKSLGKILLRDNYGFEYTGEYPPKIKMKTNLFKPIKDE